MLLRTRAFHVALSSVLVLLCGAANAASQVAVGPEWSGWAVEPFGPVAAPRIGTGFEVASTEAPGGLMFRAQVDPARTYRLLIEGTPLSGVATVRLTFDEQNPQWSTAPDGERPVIFSGRNKVEVVLYGDLPFKYLLRRMVMEECAACVDPAALLAKALPEWTVEPFGVVAWEPSEKGLLLHSAAPGGLVLRRALATDKTYRLAIEGSQFEGMTTTRVKLGDSEPTWTPAPEGRRAISWGHATVEVVVYSDTNFRYLLRHIRVDECPTCLTDGELVRRVEQEIPDLATLLTSARPSAAERLVHWAANVVDVGSPEIAAQVTPLVYMMSAAQAYDELWSAPSAGASCGAFAVFFARLLRLFGFEAFTVDMGYEGTSMTHVTTIVVTRDVEGARFYVVDPTFNGTYVDARSGQWVDLDRILNADEGTLRFRSGDIRRDYVYPLERRDVLDNMLASLGDDTRNCVVTEAFDRSLYVCPSKVYDERVIQIGWRDQMEQHGVPSSSDLLLHLLRRQVFRVDAADADTHEQFIGLLKRHEIPVRPAASQYE